MRDRVRVYVNGFICRVASAEIFFALVSSYPLLRCIFISTLFCFFRLKHSKTLHHGTFEEKVEAKRRRKKKQQQTQYTHSLTIYRNRLLFRSTQNNSNFYCLTITKHGRQTSKCLKLFRISKCSFPFCDWTIFAALRSPITSNTIMTQKWQQQIYR